MRTDGSPSVRRLLAIPSGPGVGTGEVAPLCPDADVVAVEGSPAMLDRTTERAALTRPTDHHTAHVELRRLGLLSVLSLSRDVVGGAGAEVAHEPLTGQVGNLVQRARLLEEV